MTVWQHMKENWTIDKQTIVDLGIDVKKDWYQITLAELDEIASELDVQVSDLV